jgi:hypothetical protein
MKKYIVTLVSYQDLIVEAENDEEANRIALYESNPEDWDDPVMDGEIYIEEYSGDKTAFNEKET